MVTKLAASFVDHVSAVLIRRDSIFFFEQLNEILIFFVTDHVGDIGDAEFGVLQQLGSFLQPFPGDVVGHVFTRLLFEKFGKVDRMKMGNFPQFIQAKSMSQMVFDVPLHFRDDDLNGHLLTVADSAHAAL